MEYAHQQNYGDNPNNYSADYFLLEGNSVQAFQTPLATLHAFQGWADKFLATPSDGIDDFTSRLS